MNRLSRVLAVSLAIIVVAAPSSACINTFKSIFMGHKRDGDTAAMAAELKKAEESYRKDPTLENVNDYAVGLILSDRQEEGIQLLRDLERSKPGSAVVASNLGTALELSGKDAEALEWIRESVRRDPKEHHGSEWVHVKILEAKLELAKDPAWLLRSPVLGWRVGDPPLRDEQGRPRRDGEVESAISYQLFERMVFVQSPDAVMGDLYVTAGDLESARTRNDPDALPANGYDWALKYGTVHEARVTRLLAEQQARFDKYIAERDRKARLAKAKAAERQAEQRRRRFWALWGFGSLAMIVAGYFVWQRFRKPA
jgi:hypothetical protein